MSNGDGPDGAPQIAVNGDAVMPSPTTVPPPVPRLPPLLVMAPSYLPSSPPVYSSLQPLATGGWFWDKGQLVVPVRVELPCRCVRCGKPGVKRYYLILYWMEPLWLLLLLVNWVVLVVLYLCIGKKGTAIVWLCEEHAHRRLNVFIIAGMLGALSCMVLAFSLTILAELDRKWIMLLGFAAGLLLMVLALFVGYWFTRVVRPTRIDQHWMWLKGVNPEALR